MKDFVKLKSADDPDSFLQRLRYPSKQVPQESRVSPDKIEYPLGDRPHNLRSSVSRDATIANLAQQQDRMVYIVGGINQDR